MLTEQLTQQQLYTRLIAKLLKLLMSLGRLSNTSNLPVPLSTLSNFAETRIDKGLDKDAQVNTLNEQVGNQGGGSKVWDLALPDRALNQIFTCGGFGGGGTPPDSADVCNGASAIILFNLNDRTTK